jgi:hypothetical protein
LRWFNQFTFEENFFTVPIVKNSGGLEVGKYTQGAFTPNLPPKFGVIDDATRVFRKTRKAVGRYRPNWVNIADNADI